MHREEQSPIDRSRHYMIDEFDRFYKSKLHEHPAWTKWTETLTLLDLKVAAAFAGTINLHD